MPHRQLEAARQTLDISVLELWWTYFAMGGGGDAYALAEYLEGHTTVTNTTHNAIVHALNQTFTERGQNSPVPYRDG